jgi:phospholipase C
VFDHTSVLKLIEWRWGLQPLTPRDASSDVNNLAYAFDFNNSQTSVPALPKPHTPFIPAPCFANLFGGISSEVTNPGGVPSSSAQAPSSSARNTAVWRGLRSVAQKNGFKIG